MAFRLQSVVEEPRYGSIRPSGAGIQQLERGAGREGGRVGERGAEKENYNFTGTPERHARAHAHR